MTEKAHYQNIVAAAEALRTIRNYKELTGAERSHLNDLLERLENRVAKQSRLEGARKGPPERG